MRPITPSLAALNPIDLRDALAQLPQRRDPIGQCARRDSLTIHYAGTVEPGATTDDAALAQIRSEARYHINKVWGYADKAQMQPIYGDGIMYHVAVLPSGRPAVLRDLWAELYHCGNATANRASIAITTLRGVGQPIADQHWRGVEQVCDALIADFSLAGRQAVYGHREWPRSDGTAQSICPGAIVFERLLAYRAQAPRGYPLGTYEVIADAGANVRTGPNVGFPKAINDTLVYPKGQRFSVDAVVPDAHGMQRIWLHAASGIGFVAGDAELVRFVRA
ncbi:MAG TPA: N-acetylmuramoyl-L-alanine amidase [Kouleothrix sp.]|nr:N-acetylmuramoyl-L-alanine amidase [Kouleothrix sp.]